MQSKLLHLTTFASAIVASSALWGCGGNTEAIKGTGNKKIEDNQEIREVEEKQEHQGQIADYALTPYTRDQYPQAFAKFGKRMNELEKFRRLSAEKAAASPTCDKVELVEVSPSRGHLNDMHFFADCTNGTRFRFSEGELKSKPEQLVLSEEQKAWKEADAREACGQMIRENATIPTSVDLHTFLGTSTFKAQSTGNVVVTMNFDARNVFNTKMGYTAKCYFKPGISQGEIEIDKRLQ